MFLSAGEKESTIQGRGTVNFFVKCKDDSFSQIVLKNVLYNPNLRRNLLPGSKLENFGVNFIGSRGKLIVYDKECNFLYYTVRKKLFVLLKTF